MEFFIAGGVGEHGRSCFLVQSDTICFLVDCGKMADTPDDPYPRLTPAQIRRLDAVFLTHSHADHTGALPWLYENGFAGTVIASEQTLRQLPFPVKTHAALEALCPAGSGRLPHLSLNWGRSGHCAGSVWYEFRLDGQTLLFSGDYTEASLVYCTDPIRRVRADTGVIDCAYGRSFASPQTLRFDLLTRLSALADSGKPFLLPVPKYGRGLELLYLLHHAKPQLPVCGDAQFRSQLDWLRSDRFWCSPSARDALRGVQVQPLCGVPCAGAAFVSDPQLKERANRQLADDVLAHGGSLVMTGTPEAGSYSDTLLRRGSMELLRCPVHQNETEYRALLRKNQIFRAIPYHTPDLPAKPEMRIGTQK